MHKEIIRINDKVIIEDEKGIKREIKDRTDLEETLITENNIEYLEANQEYLTEQIEKLTAEIEGSKVNTESLRMPKFMVFAVMLVFCAVVSANITATPIVHILVAIVPPALMAGIVEAFIYIQAILTKQNEEVLEKYNIALDFLEKDLEREKEKVKTKIDYKKDTFELTKVDTKELYDYKKRYDALMNIGEVEEKPKTLKKTK